MDELADAWALAREGASKFGGSPSTYFKASLSDVWSSRKSASDQPSGDADTDTASPGVAAPKPEEEGLKMVPVKSANLAAAGYDKKAGTMYVEFNSGLTYTYNCSEKLFNTMMAAASPGQFFYHNIRDDYGHSVMTRAKKK